MISERGWLKMMMAQNFFPLNLIYLKNYQSVFVSKPRKKFLEINTTKLTFFFFTNDYVVFEILSIQRRKYNELNFKIERIFRHRLLGNYKIKMNESKWKIFCNAIFLGLFFFFLNNAFIFEIAQKQFFKFIFKKMDFQRIFLTHRNFRTESLTI